MLTIFFCSNSSALNEVQVLNKLNCSSNDSKLIDCSFSSHGCLNGTPHVTLECTNKCKSMYKDAIIVIH